MDPDGFPVLKCFDSHFCIATKCTILFILDLSYLRCTLILVRRHFLGSLAVGTIEDGS